MDSPLHTSIPKRHHRRVLLSSDEDENCRQDEAIPSDCAAHGTSVSGLAGSDGEGKHAPVSHGTSQHSSDVQQQADQIRRTSQRDQLHCAGSSSSTPTGRLGEASPTGNPREWDGESSSMVTVTEPDEVIINITHMEQEGWDSDVDSASITSTPDCKRGKHADALQQAAIQEIQQDCLQLVRRNKRKPSVHLLADTRLQLWLKNDSLHCGLSAQLEF